MICLSIESPTSTTWENRFRISHTSSVSYHLMSQPRGRYGASLPTRPPFDIACSTELLSGQMDPNGLCRSKDEMLQSMPRCLNSANVSFESRWRGSAPSSGGKVHSQDGQLCLLGSCGNFQYKMTAASNTQTMRPADLRRVFRNPPKIPARFLLGRNEGVELASGAEGLGARSCCLSL